MRCCVSSQSPCGGAASLNDADRRLIARARELASLRTSAAVNERFPGWPDTASAYAEAFGTARWLLDELAGIAERAGGKRGDNPPGRGSAGH
jgi:hypothetical protein